MSGGQAIRTSSALKRLLGALRSRQPAAYWGIGVRAAAPVTRAADWLLGSLRGGRAVEAPALERCAFLACPPRSGGTVIYQALTRVLPCVYLSNAHALFPRLGTRLLRAGRERLRSRPGFRNYHGYSSGLAGVLEGNEFFKWLHRTPAAERQSLRSAFERLVALLGPRSDECAVFKNARAYGEILKLHRAVPEMTFVRVRRDRAQVAESILRAYRESGSFHPVPDSVRAMALGDPLEFAVAQVRAIEARLDEQFAELSPSARFEIPYEEFCARPHDFIRRLACDHLGLPADSLRDCPALNELRPSRRSKVSEQEGARIRALLGETQ